MKKNSVKRKTVENIERQKLIKRIQKAIRTQKGRTGIGLYDFKDIYGWNYDIIKKIEEGDVGVQMSTFLDYIEILNLELRLIPRGYRRNKDDLEFIEKVTGVDFQSLLNKANKKTP